MLLPHGALLQAQTGERGTGVVQFREVAARAGVQFVYDHSPTPEKHYIESAPGGLAVFDYNGDGRPDIFFANGAESPALVKRGPQHWNRLYRNEGGWRFTDVTEEAGVQGVGYAMGAAAADYDADGDVDLFVAGVRQHQLLRNDGGRFTDVAAEAGIAQGEWAVGGVWFDYDGDTRLDLFVINYVRWSAESPRYCGDQARGLRIYCHPRFFQGLPNRLYRNLGDGRFEDVSDRSGIGAHIGKGMSAAIADYDNDGDIDLFVANDAIPNFLFRNRGDGTFEETALLAGVSVPASGRPVSGMGSDFQDYDNDGWIDLHITALTGETFPLFRNDRSGGFVDATVATGLAGATIKEGGWCTVFADVDNDGWKDLFTANSHANDRISDFEATQWKQANSLFLNDGGRRFRSVGREAGFGDAVATHRGCGVADFDGDGRLDFVVLSLQSNAELWQNAGPAGNWITVRLVGRGGNRDAIGARVTVGDQIRTMTTTVGYASSSHAGLHFGLGDLTQVPPIEVRWPDGTVQKVEGARVNSVLTIEETKVGSRK
ncbi:MAG TPA: CRTAC1 family protein [Vicinamibacterales bacterium]